MNPKTKTRSARVWTHLSATLRDRLSSYCAASHITERAVFEAALEQYISGTRDLTLVLRRLDRLGRAADRVHRDVELLSAAFAVFVRLWFAHTPSLHTCSDASGIETAEHAMTLHFMPGVPLHLGIKGPSWPRAEPIAAAFGAITATAFARAIVPIFAPSRYFTTLLVAAALWTLAFLLYLVIDLPVLMMSRADGKPG